LIKAKLSDGSLVLGIESRNVDKLKDGQPIHVHGTEIGGFDGATQIYIMYGETLRDVYDELNEASGGQLPPFEEPQRQEHS
jgi:hypothetical protein